ncbi:histone-like nucleoid-structuring protein Lsr2 [Virgisporangium aurantiacum]|uniref:Lsr2 family protein n=1 Tax=Virgisporangium aurantiacum TaxID=175570 RepID=A0A8J4E7H3_9ACTN|nr:Lsr2 family protein [Virgisporangium aurantiacum]GIJ64556.1 Lsr2 family protein [Virgisporangium aurantiacum]
MATVIRTIVTDDLDASAEGVDTYRFALEGADYEIDLSEANRDRLRAALAPFIAAGRRLPRQHRLAARTDRTTSEIRTWWKANTSRTDLPAFRNRGVIPRQVQAAYQAAYQASQPAGPATTSD